MKLRGLSDEHRFGPWVENEFQANGIEAITWQTCGLDSTFDPLNYVCMLCMVSMYVCTSMYGMYIRMYVDYVCM